MDQELEILFVMGRRNYKIEAYLGVSRHVRTRVIAAFGTGGGSSFIKYLLIPYEI